MIYWWFNKRLTSINYDSMVIVGTCAKSWDNYSGNLAQAEKSPTSKWWIWKNLRRPLDFWGNMRIWPETFGFQWGSHFLWKRCAWPDTSFSCWDGPFSAAEAANFLGSFLHTPQFQHCLTMWYASVWWISAACTVARLHGWWYLHLQLDHLTPTSHQGMSSVAWQRRSS